MHAVTRMEIMCDGGESQKITQILDRIQGVTYSIFRNVSSHGVCGEFLEDSGITSENSYILAFCLPDAVKPLLEEMQPILNKFGGACFISDAQEVKSMRCISSM